MAQMEGYLSKKGKRIGSRVKRFMRLDGTTLSNHHTPDGPATWQVSIKDASVTANPKRKKLNIELYNAKMELYCDTKKECEDWVEALARARKELASKAKDEDKENSGADAAPAAAATGADAASKNEKEKEESDKSKAIDQLNKSFKVVRPAARPIQSVNTDSDSESDDFAGDGDEEHQPRNGPRIYEETPNSMIFKQFNFKA